jgi:four helix bundle protein
MKELESIIENSFVLSGRIFTLFCQLAKENNPDMASKIMKSNMPIRKYIDYASSAATKSEYSEHVAKALQNAITLRYWLKCIQMKNIVCPACEECVETLNHLINQLISCGMRQDVTKVLLQPQLN